MAHRVGCASGSAAGPATQVARRPATAAGRNRSRHCSAATAASTSFGRSSAVLERLSTSYGGPDDEEADAYDLITGGQLDAGFHEYAAATHKMEDLEKLSAALLANLQELNSAADALESMAPPAAFEPPMPEPLTPSASASSDARRAKRAAARQARRSAGAGARAASTPSSPVAAAASASTPAAPMPSPSAPATPRQDTVVQQLEGLMQREASPEPAVAPTSSSSTRAPSIGPNLLPSTRGGIGAGVQAPAGASSVVVSSSRRSRTRGRSSSSDVAELATTSSSGALARASNARRVRAASAGRRTAARAASTSSAEPGGATMRRGAGRAGRATSTDGTSQFMKKAASLDLLSGVSEKELTAIVKDLLFLEKVQSDLAGILNRAPTVDEWARALNMDTTTFGARLSAGQAAKAMMLQANYRLVISVCKKYQNRGIALQDLITEGVQGLLRGVEKFDADKGFRFSTYAHWWIRQAVTRSLSDQGRTVRLPAHMYELLMRIQAAKQELSDASGQEPPLHVVAKHCNLTTERVTEILEMARPSGSLDQPVGSEDDGMMSMKDMLEDERSTPDEVLDEVMLRRDLASILDQLTEREAGVVRLRFGLDGQQEMTLEDIGSHFKVTRERIRQIEAKAVRKLKQKQREMVGILHEYSNSRAEGDLAGRKSNGTNKS